jgi:hypothetical protein
MPRGNGGVFVWDGSREVNHRRGRRRRTVFIARSRPRITACCLAPRASSHIVVIRSTKRARRLPTGPASRGTCMIRLDSDGWQPENRFHWRSKRVVLHPSYRNDEPETEMRRASPRWLGEGSDGGGPDPGSRHRGFGACVGASRRKATSMSGSTMISCMCGTCLFAASRT